MTDVLTTSEDLTVNGVSLRSLARDMAWAIEFELVDSDRPFGPEYVPVKVREVHCNGVTWGFVAAEGLPGKDVWLGVSELVGDEHWNVVESGVEGTDDELDRLARVVIEDNLVRSHLKSINA